VKTMRRPCLYAARRTFWVPFTFTFNTWYGSATVVLDADHPGEVVDHVGLRCDPIQDLRVHDGVDDEAKGAVPQQGAIFACEPSRGRSPRRPVR